MATGAACGVEEHEQYLPDVRVDFRFDLSYPPYTQLRDIYPNAIKVKEREAGYNLHGIILVRLSDSDFRAYDATCTRDTKAETSALTLSADRFTAHCPKCGAEYAIQQPGAYEKNGKCRLQQYRVLAVNDYVKHVVN
jgi:nitrite reductase/ring-hydroxylating ferredoxin subunit